MPALLSRRVRTQPRTSILLPSATCPASALLTLTTCIRGGFRRRRGRARAARPQRPPVAGRRALVRTARVTRMRGLPRSEPMRVQEVMAKDPKTCRANDTLVAAARILWDHDCGCVPVVDDQGRPVGIVTDRDACMAAYTRGRRLDEIAVHGAMAKTLFTCRADDGLAQAVALMQQKQVRRVPGGGERGARWGGVGVADAARAPGRARGPP